MWVLETAVHGMQQAIYGMRNPMNSWDKSDSYVDALDGFKIGEKDMKLAQSLIMSGTEHSKFMRQIQVWADIAAARYWWSEFDTYKVGTSANSTSTMHRLFNKEEEISLGDFEFGDSIEAVDDYGETSVSSDEYGIYDYLEFSIKKLNELRKMYFETYNYEEKRKILSAAKKILPESYMNIRSINLNYATLRNIMLQRKNHRLKYEWQECFLKRFVCKLPYAKELIFCGYEKDYERLINM